MRVVRAQDDQAFEAVMRSHLEEGYRIQAEGKGSVLLKENSGYGEPWVHLIWLIVLPMLGNLLYALYAYHRGREVLIRNEAVPVRIPDEAMAKAPTKESDDEDLPEW